MLSRSLVGAALVVIACSSETPAADSEGGLLREPFDENELHITWRNLANEQVMFRSR